MSYFGEASKYMSSGIKKHFNSLSKNFSLKGLANVGLNTLGMSAGMALPMAAMDNSDEPFSKKFYHHAVDGLPVFLGLEALLNFGKLKSLRNANSIKKLKSIGLFDGPNPLVELKNKATRYKYMLPFAAAGGAINYDSENPISSTAKGIAGGLAFASPTMFKSHHRGTAVHQFADQIVDAPMFALAVPGIIGALKKGTSLYRSLKGDNDNNNIPKGYRDIRNQYQGGGNGSTPF